MNKLGLALALTLMGATAASAQGVEFRIGSDADRGWDRGRERVIVRERRGRDEDHRVRRREVESTGSTCRTTFVHRRNKHGEMVRERVRDCD